MEIKLSEPRFKGTRSLEECILERKSVRSFEDRDLEKEKISQILWAGQGQTNGKKTVPSAGATYPLELYAVLKRKGVFHYQPEKNILECVREGDFGRELAEASLYQMFIHQASLNVIICADFERTCQHYGRRGERYVYIEIGHCAQNIHLEAVALGLASVPVGAFYDEEVKRILNLPQNIDPVYIIPVGYKK
ncbi:MAG: SagB/ThcOx family dehydrogenase [Candidatus Aminicenantales bacterium]